MSPNVSIILQITSCASFEISIEYFVNFIISIKEIVFIYKSLNAASTYDTKVTLSKLSGILAELTR